MSAVPMDHVARSEASSRARDANAEFPDRTNAEDRPGE